MTKLEITDNEEQIYLLRQKEYKKHIDEKFSRLSKAMGYTQKEIFFSFKTACVETRTACVGKMWIEVDYY